MNLFFSFYTHWQNQISIYFTQPTSDQYSNESDVKKRHRKGGKREPDRCKTMDWEN